MRRAKREQRAEQRGLKTAPRLHPFFGDAEEAGHVVAVVRAGRNKLKQTRMKKGHWPVVVHNRRRKCGVILLSGGTAHQSGSGRGWNGRPHGISPECLLLPGDSGGIASCLCVRNGRTSGWRLWLHARRVRAAATISHRNLI